MLVYCGGGSGRGPPASAPMDVAGMVRDGDVYLTDDAEVKQTAYVSRTVHLVLCLDAQVTIDGSQVKRRCHNCDHRSPPSWRKSVLRPGKIVSHISLQFR
jgi:hypothetical protein